MVGVYHESWEATRIICWNLFGKARKQRKKHMMK